MRFSPFCLALLLPVAAAAQVGQVAVVNAAPAAPTYQGPGDVVSGATAWYGLRAYNAAYAASLGKAVNIRRASDSVACDVLVAATGALGVTSATCDSSTQGGITPAAFAGTDATAACSTTGSSTTLACTGASSTPHASDPISGTGITQPAYIVSCGTFTAGAGSCTMNVAQNIGVAETVTFQNALFVAKWYDQTGGNACGAASCDLVQATSGNQPQLLMTCLNGGTLPCIASGNSATPTLASANNITPATGIVTFSTLSWRPTSGSSYVMMEENSGANRFVAAVSANSWILFGGTSGTVSATASDTVPHSGIGIISNGSSSCSYIDGVATPVGCTGTTVTGSTTAGKPLLMGTSGVLYIGESFFYDGVAMSSANAALLHTNQSAYWSTP